MGVDWHLQEYFRWRRHRKLASTAPRNVASTGATPKRAPHGVKRTHAERGVAGSTQAAASACRKRFRAHHHDAAAGGSTHVPPPAPTDADALAGPPVDAIDRSPTEHGVSGVDHHQVDAEADNATSGVDGFEAGSEEEDGADAEAGRRLLQAVEEETELQDGEESDELGSELDDIGEGAAEGESMGELEELPSTLVVRVTVAHERVCCACVQPQAGALPVSVCLLS